MKRLGRALLWLAALCVALSALLVLALRWIDPPTSAFMLRAQFAAHADNPDFHLRHEWKDKGDISAHLQLAVIAAEDQQFAQHCGFDVKSINRAWQERSRGKRMRGASTLTQQVAKNLFLWPGQSWVRKGIESYLTVLIELLWTKHRILEVYVNVAEFGRGIYGAEAATRRFFGKSASRITPAEAALLAAVLPNPSRLKADSPSRYVRTRQQWILGQMRALGGTGYLRDL